MPRRTWSTRCSTTPGATLIRNATNDWIPDGLLEPPGKPPEGQMVIERRVAERGVISVAGETFSVGRHLAYRIVTIAGHRPDNARLTSTAPSSRPSVAKPTNRSARSDPKRPPAASNKPKPVERLNRPQTGTDQPTLDKPAIRATASKRVLRRGPRICRHHSRSGTLSHGRWLVSPLVPTRAHGRKER